MTKQQKIDILKKHATWKPDIGEQALDRLGCKVICEVGVRKGGHFRHLMMSNPTLAVAVDCWKEVPGKPIAPNTNIKKSPTDENELAVEESLGWYGVDSVTGLALGWVSWLSQTLMVIIFGGLSLFILPFINRNYK